MYVFRLFSAALSAAPADEWPSFNINDKHITLHSLSSLYTRQPLQPDEHQEPAEVSSPEHDLFPELIQRKAFDRDICHELFSQVCSCKNGKLDSNNFLQDANCRSHGTKVKIYVSAKIQCVCSETVTRRILTQNIRLPHNNSFTTVWYKYYFQRNVLKWFKAIKYFSNSSKYF